MKKPENNNEKAKLLRQWLGVLIDCIDYSAGGCEATSMVGAVLPSDTLAKAKEAMRLTVHISEQKGESL